MSMQRASLQEPREESMATDNRNGTNTLHLALAWGWVGLPLTIGVVLTLVNAMKLFQ